jgi:hypothetical protein
MTHFTTLRKVIRMFLASGGSIVVEHMPRLPKVEGSSPATAAGLGREKMGKDEEVSLLLVSIMGSPELL